VAYSGQAEVETAARGRKHLIQLTSSSNAGEVDAAVLARAIASADATIDSYAQKRYATGFAAPVPPKIVETSAELAVFYLKKWKGMLTDDDRTDHEETMTWLLALSEGKVSCGTEPMPPSSSQVNPEIVPRDGFQELDPELLTRASMRGFT
jgi:phage gp36-like protein